MMRAFQLNGWLRAFGRPSATVRPEHDEQGRMQVLIDTRFRIDRIFTACERWLKRSSTLPQSGLLLIQQHPDGSAVPANGLTSFSVILLDLPTTLLVVLGALLLHL